MSKDTGGPAFPHWDGPTGQCFNGITMRDYFAAKAMRIMWEAYDKGYCGDLSPDTRNNQLIAEGAYQIADAMIEARAK